jgi:NAD(P)-dependent dehydrogenase (short-subunit alcohol dehydrogenase family)
MPTIIMTGGTSGFGTETVKQLLKLPNTHLFLGARRENITGLEILKLDMVRLSSVRTFADTVIQKLGDSKIDALILNAGVSLSGGNCTPDGFETTFAVNHLAHYLLLRLLLPHMANGSSIILTTSGTYDPSEKTIIPPPRHANAKLLAHPELDPDLDQDPATAGGRAYASSKLCIVLTVRALATNPEIIKKNITVLAYDPGPTPGTGLVRSTNFAVRAAWHILSLPVILPFLHHMNSRAASGKALADLALGKIFLPEGKVYAALRHSGITWPDLSTLASQDDLVKSLWNDSAELVGLPR